jgi:ribosome biogenesis protein BRX1
LNRLQESLFVVNEIAEMKNCNKCLLFEGRKKRDLYLWAANIARYTELRSCG